MRTNKYYIDESLLEDNESINHFFYLNGSRYHRYQVAQSEYENSLIKERKVNHGISMRRRSRDF